jgi:signal transduction histidine kinase
MAGPGRFFLLLSMAASCVLLPAQHASSAPAARAAAIVTADSPYPAAEKAIERTKTAMMSDPASALASARTAVALTIKLPSTERGRTLIATAQWLEGEARLGLNDVDGAGKVVTEALKVARTVASGTKLQGDLLRSQGAIQATKGDFIGALASYQEAFRAFRSANVERSQALALLDIGQIYSDAGDHKKALDYYSRSAEAYSGDPGLALPQNNSSAEVFRKLGRFDEAAKSYELALKAAIQLESPLLQVRILTNLANAQIDAGKLALAQKSIDRALFLSAHGEAAGWRPFVFGAAAKVSAQRGASQDAARLFRQTFDGVDLATSDMSYREYHRAASQVFETIGESQLALRHFRAFQRLESESSALTASAAAQLSSAAFDFAGRELQIEKLQRERLERDIAIERQRAEFRNTLFIGLLTAGGIVFGALLFGFLSVRRSRNDVRAANDTLSQTNVKLEKALAAKTEFLAMTSHEIRTPLNGILGMTSVLLADRAIAADTRSRLEVVNSAGETMRALVDDILDVAKMESGEISLVHEPTDVRAILNEAGRLWSGMATQKNIGLHLEIADLPVEIMSDAGRLRQIIFNLMSNALKFTHKGEVRVQGTCQPTPDGGEEMVIAVTDTGIGIAPDKHALIFESFRQVDAATTRQYSGTGLGLAICNKLVGAMGGRIEVASALGEGATFTVTIPLERTARGATEADEPAAANALAEATLLALVANAPENVMLKMSLLTSVANAELSPDIAQAKLALADQKFDLVLVDCDAIEGESGAVVDALRQLIDAAGESPVSILISSDGRLPIANALMAGAAQVIVKPIEVPDILEAVAGLLGPSPDAFVAPSLAA